MGYTLQEFKRPYIIEQDIMIVRKGALLKDIINEEIYDFMEEDNLKVKLIRKPRFKINKNKHGESIFLRLIFKAMGRYKYVNTDYY